MVGIWISGAVVTLVVELIPKILPGPQAIPILIGETF